MPPCGITSVAQSRASNPWGEALHFRDRRHHGRNHAVWQETLLHAWRDRESAVFDATANPLGAAVSGGATITFGGK